MYFHGAVFKGASTRNVRAQFSARSCCASSVCANEVQIHYLRGAYQLEASILQIIDEMPRVYVGRLSYNVREKDIQRFFSGYGKLLEIDLKNG